MEKLNLLQQLSLKEITDRANDVACSTADDSDYIYRQGIEAMVTEWAKNKGQLYQLLGKNLKISKTYEAKATYKDIKDDLMDFRYAFLGDGFTTKKDGKVFISVLGRGSEELCYGFYTPSFYLMQFLGDSDSFNSIQQNKILENSEWLKEANNLLGIEKSYVGMKVTKVMRNILIASVEKMFNCNFIDEKQRKRGLYEVEVTCQYYSRLVEKIQSLMVSHTVWLSIDPSDFMRCSYGDCWESCHKLGNMHGDGAVQYCINPTTMIAYEEKIDSNQDVKPLKWRQVVYTNEDLSRFVGSRQYRHTSDTNARAVQEMIKECMEKNVGSEVEWDLTDYSSHGTDTQSEIRCCVKTGRNGYAYDDISLYSRINKQLWMLSEKSNEECEDEECELATVYVNSLEYNICLCCGEKYYGHRDDMYTCENCQTDKTMCERCGEYHDEDDMTYVESVNEWVCDGCLDSDFGRCENCEEYHLLEDMTTVADGDMVCSDCLERRYSWCENCGEYHRCDEVGTYTSEKGWDYDVCDACVDECTVYCEECGERTHVDEFGDCEACRYCGTPFNEEE